MNKEDLVQAVLKGANLPTKKQAQEIIELILETITSTLKRGEDVALTGFGTFKTVKRAARQGINPKTGEKIQIAAATKPKFSAGKLLKEAVK